MRKVLALVLALAMVLGCFASVFAAEYTDVKADADYATAVSVLSDLGVVSGYTDGTYKPEKVVTRAEMAALLIKALGLTPAKSATTNFSDVPASHWASGYVAYANTLGIIAGYTDGTFKPEKTVSYDEAITMIISALGYKAEALEGNTWPTAYILKAQTLGITDGVDLLGSAGANRADIAELLFNTLGCQLGKTNKDGEFKETAGDTMYKRLGATVDTDAEGNPEAKLISSAEVAKAKIDLSEDLGAMAVAVRNSKKEIIAIQSYETEFVEGEYKAGETIGSMSIKGWTVGTNCFVNGKEGGTFADATKFAVDKAAKKIVSAIYWEATYTDKATADVKADATKVIGYELPLNEDGKTVDTEAFELLGVASLGEIKKGNVVSVYYEGNNTANEIVRVEVGTETVIGKITKVTGTKATINGASYKKPGSVDFDAEYIVYLDYAGNQFGETEEYTPSTTPAEYQYGVVLAAGVVTSTDAFADDDDVRQVKMVTKDGAVVLTVAEAKDSYAPTGLVKMPAGGAKDFKGSISNGTYVKFKVNDDNKLTDMVKLTSSDFAFTTTADYSVKNSMINGKAIASDVLVFAADDATLADAKFTVATTLADGKYTGIYTILNDKAQVAYIFVGPDAAAGVSDSVYGIYTGVSQVGTKKFELTFFVDGEEKVYTYAGTAAPSITADGTLRALSLTDGAYESNAAFPTAQKTSFTVATKAAINGSTYIVDGDVNNSAVLSSTVIYYQWDGSNKKLTVSDEETFLKAKGTVTLYDVTKDGDSIYDIVVFNK